jgi:hypothetical protein
MVFSSSHASLDMGDLYIYSSNSDGGCFKGHVSNIKSCLGCGYGH